MVVFKINKLLVVLLVAVGWFGFGGLQVVWAEPQFGGVVEELIECDCTNNTYIRVGDPHGGDLGTEGEYIKNSSTKAYDCEPLIQGEWILGMHTENMENCEIRMHGACVKIHEGKVVDFYGSDNCPGAMGASSSGGGGGTGSSSTTSSSSHPSSSSHSSHGSSSSSSSGSSANNSSSHSSHSSTGHSTSNNSSGQVTHNSSGNRNSDENNTGNSSHSGNNQSGGQNILNNNVTNHDTNSSERDNHQQVAGGNNSLSNNITNNDSANSALSTSVVSQGEQLEDKNILWKQILAGFSFAMAGFFVWRAGMKLMNG